MDAMIVALGSTRYRVDRPWPGADFDVSAISDVAVLADGNIALVRRKTPQALILSPQGQLIGQWHINGLVCPHYVRPDHQGGLLIADLDGHQIIAVGPSGETRWTLGDPQKPNWMTPFNHPTCACPDENGNVYVTDGYGNSCLHSFDAEQNLRYTVGSQGNKMGQFTTPHAVICLRDGRLLVSDRENNRLQFFTHAGEPQGQILDVFKPMALASLPDGTILVTDQTPRLSRLAPDGRLLGRCRTFSTVAHGMGVAPDGTIYLAEMEPNVLTRLVPIAA